MTSTTRRNHRSQAVDVTVALVVAENMEEPTVEHRVERFPQIIETKSILHQERAAIPRSTAFVMANSMAFAEVYSHRIMTGSSSQKGVLAGAASCVEHTSDEVPALGQAIECWLGSPDVPCGWGLGRVDGIEVVTRALH